MPTSSTPWTITPSTGLSPADAASLQAQIEQLENALSPEEQQLLNGGEYDRVQMVNQVPYESGDVHGRTLYCDEGRQPDFQVASLNGTANGYDSMAHEAGHGIDDELGMETSTPFFSNSSFFTSALLDDINAQGSVIYESNYGGLNLAGPQEVFADAFEAMMDVQGGAYPGAILPNTDNRTAADFISDFPNVVKAINQALSAAPSHMVDGVYPDARNCPQPLPPNQHSLLTQVQNLNGVSPLIIELSNDAVHTTSLNGGIYFDMENSGFDHLMAWAGPNDGMLFLDSANDGVIANGAQLFGQTTPLTNGQLAPTGFAALAQYDTNNSGQINSNDSVWSELKVELGNGSVVSLNSLGIIGINLAYNAVNVIDANGNNDAWNGSFVYANGALGTVADYKLQEDTYDSYSSTVAVLSNAVLALPDVAGSGIVAGLQQSMQADNSGVLQGLVEQFVASPSQSAQNSLLNQIIVNWTGVNNVAPNTYGSAVNAQLEASLQKFNGATFQLAGDANGNVPSVIQGQELTEIYAQTEESIYAQLEFGGAINDLATLMVNSATYEGNGIGDTYTYDLTSVANALISQDQTDHNDAQARLTEFIRSLNAFDFVGKTNFQAFENDITGGASDLTSVFVANNSLVNPVVSQSNMDTNTNFTNDVSAKTITITGTNDFVNIPLGDIAVTAPGGNATIQGNLGNDTISIGGGTNNVYWQSASVYETADNLTYIGVNPGSDVVNIGSGNNTVDQGYGNMVYNVNSAGTDTLETGAFNDSFNLVEGFGTVNIQLEPVVSSNATETVNFGSGISANSIIATGAEGNLLLSFGSGNNLNILSGLVDVIDNRSINDFAFSGGNSFTLNQLLTGAVTDTLAQSAFAYNFSNAAIQQNFTLTGSNDSLVLPMTGVDTATLTGTNDVVSNIGANDTITDNGSRNTFLAGGQGTIKIGTNDTISGAASEIKLGGTSLQNDVTFVLSAGNTYGLTATLPGSNTLNLNSVLNTAGGGNTILQFSDNSTISLAQFLQTKSFSISNTTSNTNIQRTNSFANENITNSGSNDSIYLGTGNDVVTDSGNGNLWLAGSGNSTITVGKNDTFVPTFGHTKLQVNTGTGNTVLQYSTTPPAQNDNIYFGTGIAANSLVLSANGNNAILKIDNAGDELSIIDGFNDHIGSLYFSNGTSETYASLLQAGVTVTNTLNNSSVSYQNTIANENITNSGKNDTISLGNGTDKYTETSINNQVYGGSGNDTFVLNSTATNDTMNLGSGTSKLTDSGHNNTIYTQSSKATVTGGANDTLVAGTGNSSLTLGVNDSAFAAAAVDAFTYTKNDATATITEGAAPTVAGSTDSLTFGAGITSSELTATVNGTELSLTIADGATNDNINIYSEINQGSNKVINSFNFSNNSSLTLAQVLALPVVNSKSNTSIYYNGSNQNQTYINNGSNDSLSLSNGNDTYTDNGSANQIYVGTGTTNVVTINSISQNDGVILSSGNATVTINANSTGDSIYEGGGKATITDSGHNNTIVGAAGNSTITSGSNDSIFGGAGNATITLLQNDSVSTAGGVDTMKYAVNDAYNIIFEGQTPTTAGTTDVLSFGTGITAANLQYHEYGNDLQLTLNDGHTNDVVYIASELNQGSNKVINSFQFSNNSTLTLAQLVSGAHPNVVGVGPGVSATSQTDEASTDNSASVVSPAANSSSPTVDSSTSNASPSLAGSVSNSAESSTIQSASTDSTLASNTASTSISSTATSSTTADAATNVVSINRNRKDATLGAHHLSAVKDAMSKFSDKSDSSNVHTNLSNKQSVSATSGKLNDKDTATSKADKYALSTGKFLTGSDYALTVQNLAAFAAEKSEYSGATAKHTNNHDLAQLAVAHH